VANEFIKAERVAAQALGILEREIVLPNLVWRDAGLDFRGAKDDTVSLRVPAYTTARRRDLRGAAGVAAPTGRQIITDSLAETKVDVTLDTDLYKSVAITDEELTLDIVDFGRQVNQPVIASVAREAEDALAEEMEGATYEVALTIDEEDPYLALVDARSALNLANVPAGQRFLAVGSSVEAAILKSDRLSKFDQSGSDSALREATIGRIAGFTAVSVPGLDPDMAIAGHRTAFVMASQVPVIPDGVTWGANATYSGFGMRTIRDYDYANVQDRFLADVFVGYATTADRGTVNASGRFEPDHEEDPIVVRAVKLTLGGS
jgi:hypothetical protein